jgi:hypothetical protein
VIAVALAAELLPPAGDLCDRELEGVVVDPDWHSAAVVGEVVDPVGVFRRESGSEEWRTVNQALSGIAQLSAPLELWHSQTPTPPATA